MTQADFSSIYKTPDLPNHPEEILHGIGLSSGIAMGPAFMLDSVSPEVNEYKIIKKNLKLEIERFEKARERSYNQIAQLLSKAEITSSSNDSEEITLLLEAHLGMLYSSRFVRGVRKRIEENRLNAEAAVRYEMEDMERVFAELDDSYIASRGQDVSDVGKRLLRNLTDQKYTAIKNIPDGGILLSEEITPMDLASLPSNRIAGLMSLVGTRQGHTGIMARSMGIPAVSSTGSMPKHVHSNSYVIIDGAKGILIVNPTEETWKKYRRQKEIVEIEHDQATRQKDFPAYTKDKVEVLVQANLTHFSDMDRILKSGASGIGLVRTEFMFMGREDLPDAREQFAKLKAVVKASKKLPVTIRTMDIGGDKMAPALNKRFGIGPNPALGLRAIRLSLSAPELLEAQMEAILRAAVYGNVDILVPMVSSVDEIKQVRAVMESTLKDLRKKNVKVPSKLPKLGAMIEIPAAIFIADELAKECDFFSLGTNDLVQYTLAADRGDEAMGQFYNPVHPAILKMIKICVDACDKANIPLSVCGELAGDPTILPLFIAMGIRKIAVQPLTVPDVKKWVRTMNVGDFKQCLEQGDVTTQEGIDKLITAMSRCWDIDKVVH